MSVCSLVLIWVQLRYNVMALPIELWHIRKSCKCIRLLQLVESYKFGIQLRPSEEKKLSKQRNKCWTPARVTVVSWIITIFVPKRYIFWIDQMLSLYYGLHDTNFVIQTCIIISKSEILSLGICRSTIYPPVDTSVKLVLFGILLATIVWWYDSLRSYIYKSGYNISTFLFKGSMCNLSKRFKCNLQKWHF